MEFIPKFIVRLMINSIGIWFAAKLFDGVDINDQFRVAIIAGAILAIVNMFIKPILVILSLPFIVISLGLFIVIINGLLILIVSSLYDNFVVNGFLTAVMTGVIIGITNWAVTYMLDVYHTDSKVRKH